MCSVLWFGAWAALVGKGGIEVRNIFPRRLDPSGARPDPWGDPIPNQGTLKMKIIVAVKRVVDYNVKVRVKSD
ncbi:MAG: hypothetical protein V4757_08820, partial [Pseudomonadota bacterium]